VDVLLMEVEFPGFEAFLEGFENKIRTAAFDLLDGRDFLPLDHLARVALDRLETVDFPSVDEGNRTARASGAACAADAVDVVLRVCGKVIVEDDVDLIDVETAGGHVRGDEQFHRSVAEALEGALAHLLGDVPVQA